MTTTPRIENLDFQKFRKKRSFARSFVRSAVISAENSNCLLDLYNARANLDFLRMFFAANFNPVQKLKNRQILSSVRQNLDFFLIFNGIRAKSKFLIMGVVVSEITICCEIFVHENPKPMPIKQLVLKF